MNSANETHFVHIQVDETRLDNVTHKEAVDVFCSTEDTVSLLVEKNAESFIQVCLVRAQGES